jgi:hypothetical protein
MPDITLEMFVHDYDVIQRKSRMRKGQCAWNLLWQIHPGLAERTRGALVDPFYDDKLLPLFWQFLGEHWDDA